MKLKDISWIPEIAVIIFTAFLLINEKIEYLTGLGIIIFLSGILFLQLIAFIIKKIEDGAFTRAIDKIKDDLQSISRKYSESEIQRKKTESFYQDQVQHFEDFRTESEETEKIVAELVNKGCLSNDDILDSMSDTDMYWLYCYANKPVKSTSLPKRREYVQKIQELGFIRLPVNSPVYISTSDLIKPKFRDVSKLKKLIAETVKKSLNEEFSHWKEILRSSSHLGSKQQEFLDLGFSEAMKSNILLFRGKLSETNFATVNGIIFNDDILKIFREHSIKSGLNLSREKKTKVIEFVKNISLESFLTGLPEHVEIILTNEGSIKRNLGLKGFMDYFYVKESNLSNELQKHVSEQFASEFTKQIKDKVTNYKTTLEKLRII